MKHEPDAQYNIAITFHFAGYSPKISTRQCVHLRSMTDQTPGPKQSRRDERTTKAYGVVLHTYRKHAHITQEELAARCDMDRAYISEIERGLKEPCLSTLLKIG